MLRIRGHVCVLMWEFRVSNWVCDCFNFLALCLVIGKNKEMKMFKLFSMFELYFFIPVIFGRTKEDLRIVVLGGLFWMFDCSCAAVSANMKGKG